MHAVERPHASAQPVVQPSLEGHCGEWDYTGVGSGWVWAGWVGIGSNALHRTHPMGWVPGACARPVGWVSLPAPAGWVGFGFAFQAYPFPWALGLIHFQTDP